MTQVIHAVNTAAVVAILLGAGLCAAAGIAHVALPHNQDAATMLTVSSVVAVLMLLLVIIACVAREICCRAELDQVRTEAFERAESTIDMFELADGLE